jgi:hypothetical protein
MTFKKIKKGKTNFYVLETSSTKFAVYDSEFDVPIYYGSWNMVEGIIKNIKLKSKDASIYYYVINKDGPLKLDPSFSHNI